MSTPFKEKSIKKRNYKYSSKNKGKPLFNFLDLDIIYGIKQGNSIGDY